MGYDRCAEVGLDKEDINFEFSPLAALVEIENHSKNRRDWPSKFYCLI